MSRKLDDLSPKMRPLAVELLARLTEAGIPVLVVDTLRTPDEHAENLRKGTSWTIRSKHLDGEAIDIVPYAVFNLNGEDKLAWDANHPVWKRVGEIGESVDVNGQRLIWGGRWKVRDMGHFERKST